MINNSVNLLFEEVKKGGKMKSDFIKTNFKKDSIVYSSDGEFGFLGKQFLEGLPKGYRRVGIVPAGTPNSYLPRHSELCYGNSLNVVAFVIITEDGYIKPNSYQQRIIRQCLPDYLKMLEEQKKKEVGDEKAFTKDWGDVEPITEADVWVK